MDGAAGGAAGAGQQPTGESAADALEVKAKQLAAKINLKTIPKVCFQQSGAVSSCGQEGQPTISAKTVADHLAAKLNAKLNYQPQENETPESLEEKGAQSTKKS